MTFWEAVILLIVLISLFLMWPPNLDPAIRLKEWIEEQNRKEDDEDKASKE